MACKFSCFLNYSDALKVNDGIIFRSDNGEQYKVKYRSNVCRDLLIKIEWTVPKEVLVAIELYNTTFKKCFSAKGIVINGNKTFMKLRGAFNVSSARTYKVLCVINLIPYVKFHNYKEFPSESMHSGFTEPECKSLSVHGNYEVIEEITESRQEGITEHKNVNNNSTIKIHDINTAGLCKISATVIDSELVTNEEIFNAHGECDNITKNININICESRNVLISGQISENTLNMFENNALENNEVKLIKGSKLNNSESVSSNVCMYAREGQPASSVSSNDASIEMSDLAETKSQNASINEKSFTLNNESEELMKNMDTTIHKGLEQKNIFEKNNSAMELSSTGLSFENSSASQAKAKCSSDTDFETNEVFVSNNVNSKSNQIADDLFYAMLVNRNSSDDVDETVTTTADVEIESNYVFVTNNQTVINDIATLPNNISTYNHNADPLIKCNDTHPPITSCKTPPIHRTTAEIKDAEVNDRVTDNHKSVSQNLSISKTGLVLQMLVHKISSEDSDHESPDVNGEAASSSKFLIKNSPESNISKENIFPVMEDELKGLSMDMLDLLTTGELSDAIITNGEKHIKVHRAIVSARSIVLKEMFIKHRQDEVKYRAVVDIPSDILEDVLIFLYVGLIYIKSTKMAYSVYQVAERYCINDLTDICSKHLSL